MSDRSRSGISPAAGMLLTTLFWGGNFTASKVAFEEIPPLAFTAVRFLLGAILLWVIVRRTEGRVKIPAEMILPLTILGVLGNTIYQFLFVEGLARTSATKTSLILAALPVVVTMSAWALGIEPVSRRQRAAVLIATVGVVAVVLGKGGSIGGGIGTGELLLLAATLAWAAYTLLLRHYALPLSALSLTAWTVYTAVPSLFLLGLPQITRTDWGAVSLAGWGGLAYSTLLSLVAAYILWTRGVTRLGASRAALYNSMVPFIATAIAVIALGERPGILHVVGGGLIVAGVLLASRGNSSRLAES